jgi:hypothetical protein
VPLLIILSSPIVRLPKTAIHRPLVRFPKAAIRRPHKTQCLWIMTAVLQVITSTVLQANRNGSMTVCTPHLVFRIALSPLPEREDILLYHLYDLRMFSHRNQYNTTAAAANAIPSTLDGNLRQPLRSLFKTEKLVQRLSDLQTNTIHMCKNSCCAFDGPFAKRDHCPFCKHARRNRKGIPYKIFRPIPLIPRLQAMYANPDMALAMRYRANYHEPDVRENAEKSPNNAYPPSPQPNDAPPPSPRASVPQVARSRMFLTGSIIAISVTNRSKFHPKMKTVSKPYSIVTLKTSEMSHLGSHSTDSPSTKRLGSRHKKLNTTHGHLSSSTTTSIQPSEPIASMSFRLE